VKYLLATTPLPELDATHRLQLEPFISVLDRVLLERARRAGFRKAGRRTLRRLAREINHEINHSFGHGIEAEIVLFALRRCVRRYDEAVATDAPLRLCRQQLRLIDCLWRIVLELAEFHGLPAMAW